MRDHFFVSVDGVRWVLNYSESKGSARLVLIVLATLVDQEAHSWPTIETLCSGANLARATVFQAIGELEDLKEVVVDRGGGRDKKNIYFLPKLKVWLDKRETDRNGSTYEENSSIEQETVQNSSIYENKETKDLRVVNSSASFRNRSETVQSKISTQTKESTYLGSSSQESKRVSSTDSQSGSSLLSSLEEATREYEKFFCVRFKSITGRALGREKWKIVKYFALRQEGTYEVLVDTIPEAMKDRGGKEKLNDFFCKDFLEWQCEEIIGARRLEQEEKENPHSIESFKHPPVVQAYLDEQRQERAEQKATEALEKVEP